MKKLLIPLFGRRVGKVFTEERRLALNIPDVIWNNPDIFEEITLTYTYISGLVGDYVPSVGAGKPTTAKFRAYVKLYSVALYFNNKESFEAGTFVFDNRWVPTTDPEGFGFVVVSRTGAIGVKEASSDSYGIVFKNEEDAVLVIELFGTVLNNMFL